MATEIYGASDDLIEFYGDVSGEVSCYNTEDTPVLLICSDGTLLRAQYGKDSLGVWEIRLLRMGDLFDRIDTCLDEDAERHSDVAYFKDGLKWAYSATNWEKVN